MEATQSTGEIIQEEFTILTQEAADKMGMPVEGVIAILVGQLVVELTVLLSLPVSQVWLDRCLEDE